MNRQSETKSGQAAHFENTPDALRRWRSGMLHGQVRFAARLAGVVLADTPLESTKNTREDYSFPEGSSFSLGKMAVDDRVLRNPAKYQLPKPEIIA